MKFERKFYANGSTNGDLAKNDLGSGGRSWEDAGLKMSVIVVGATQVTEAQWMQAEITRRVNRQLKKSA